MTLALRLFTAVGLVLAAPYADASEEKPLSEQDFLFNLPPVLSASRLVQPIEHVPAAITVIDREQLERAGLRQLPDILRLVPGMIVGNLDGNQPAASYHGLGDQYARRMQILVDGRPVYSPMFGGVDWIDLPLTIQDIDRIEVVRGPNAATHGANAFLGVISIITRHATETQGWSAASTVGQYQRQSFRYGGQATNVFYRVTLARDMDDGFDKVRDSRHYRYLSTRADIRLSDQDTLALHGGLIDGKREAGFENEAINTPHHEYHRSYVGQIQWVHQLGDDSAINLQAYTQNRHFRKQTHTLPIAIGPIPPQQYEITANLDQETRSELELAHTLSPLSSLRLAWGGSLRNELVRATGYISGPSSKVSNQLRRGFADAVWQPNPFWSLHAGLMTERDRLAGNSTSPRVALNLQPWRGHTFRFSESRATRNPALFEQRGDFSIQINDTRIRFILTDQNLSTERIRSRDIGYLLQWPDKRLNVDIRLFDDRIDQLVNLTKRADRNQPNYFRNESGIRVRGADIQLAWLPIQSVDLRASYARNLTRALSDSTPDELTESVPHYTFTGAVGWRHGPITGHLSYFRVGKMVWMWEGDRIRDIHRWDASVSYSARIARLNGKLAMSVQNLTDSRHMDFFKDNLARRTTAVTLSLDY
ncbi:TonB-dependent receptor [Chitinivorax sp. B]|uniref:TonB-dependent receptor plug domain-containing protein n=1 Tax=Chitinivorax sp. B TaxID=2502235 RepID=UPI0010F48AF3|nr:TonB-dependent receptor [Chitinivorax sp. B]